MKEEKGGSYRTLHTHARLDGRCFLRWKLLGGEKEESIGIAIAREHERACLERSLSLMLQCTWTAGKRRNCHLFNDDICTIT